MRKTLIGTLVTGLILAAVALGGCSGSKAPSVAPAVAVDERPPLQVPSSFPSDNAKREFALKAVSDGYYAEAAPLLESVLAKTPEAFSYANLGTARLNLKDYTGAVEAFSKAAELNSAMAAEMKNNIGNALRENGNLTEAQNAYRESIKLDPKRWTAPVNLAFTLQSQGNMTEAVKVLEAAVQANPDVPALSTILSSYQQVLKQNS